MAADQFEFIQASIKRGDVSGDQLIWLLNEIVGLRARVAELTEQLIVQQKRAEAAEATD